MKFRRPTAGNRL